MIQRGLFIPIRESQNYRQDYSGESKFFVSPTFLMCILEILYSSTYITSLLNYVFYVPWKLRAYVPCE